jgi:uncharacterized protein YbjT (DUF2867 family)
VLLLTGATGTLGAPLLRRLVASGRLVRCLVRDSRRLGPERVRVQIALGDLADPPSFRHALRGVDTVVHLASPLRDQPRGSIEELIGVGTWRLVHAAEQAGVSHFVFLSALGASTLSPARFLRAKALAERAVGESGLRYTIFAPSLIYAPGDKWLRLADRLALMLPVLPLPAHGRSRYQPIWAEDAADCVMTVLDGEADGSERYDLAGPDELSVEAIAHLILRASRRDRPLVPVPSQIVRATLRAADFLTGPAAVARPEEAQLLEVSMTSPRGTADVERLGVSPRPMAAVLGAP